MRKIRIVEILLSLILIGFIGYFFMMTLGMDQLESLSRSQASSYHVAIITDQSESYSFESFLAGFEEFSRASNMAFQEYQINKSSSDSLEKVFEQALITQADGLIVYLSNNNEATSYIQRARELDIPTVVVGNDAPKSFRDVYIGTNKYALGKEVVAILEEDTESFQSISVLLGQEYTNVGLSNNNLVAGMYDAANNLSRVKIMATYFTGDERAELIVRKMVNNNDANVIFFTDPIDSLRGIKTLIDLNYLQQYTIIASGNMPQLIDYVNKGTIYGTVIVDHRAMGSISAEHMVKLLEGERVSSYVSIPFRIERREEMNPNE